MKKDFDRIMDSLTQLHNEVDTLKKLTIKQNESIEELKKQLEAVSTVKIEEEGKQTVDSYGNLILDEIISVKKKLEGFSAEGLRGVVNDVASLKNKLEEKAEGEYSLEELKEELLKLADMVSD